MQIGVCCGTFLLYSPPWSATAQTPHGTPLRGSGQPRLSRGGHQPRS
jgi:hypothetical protein